MQRATVSTFTQISCASGISISPCAESTTSSGVPEMSAPLISTSRTRPICAPPRLAHFAAHQVADIIASRRELHAVGKRHLDFEAYQLFGVVNRIAGGEVEYCLAAAAVRKPALADVNAAGRAAPVP